MVIVEHLRKYFGETRVLEDVSLVLNDGEILTVIGMSGVGKSVLMKTIVGLIEPDGGRVLFDGVDITNLSESEYNDRVRSRMSMIFQQGALWDSMTIEENIDLALSIRRNLSRKERAELIRESLELVGLPDVQKMYPEELSGGMIKRASIARAIAARPKYLLYDEPTTGLDPVLAEMVNRLIISLHRELHTTSLIISHDIENLRKFSQRVALLFDGRIVHECAASEMWQQSDPVFNGFIRGEVGILS